MNGMEFKKLLGTFERLLRIVDGINREQRWDGDALDKNTLSFVMTDNIAAAGIRRVFEGVGLRLNNSGSGSKSYVVINGFKKLEGDDLQKVFDGLEKLIAESGERVKKRIDDLVAGRGEARAR